MNRISFPTLALLGLCASTACSSTDEGALDATTRADAGPIDAATVDGSSADGSTADAGADAGGGSPDAAPIAETCADGSALTRFSLTPLAVVPTLAALGLPDPIPGTIIANAGTEGAHQLRFDVCTPAGGAPRLQSLQAIETSFEQPRLYVVDPAATTQTETFVDTPNGKVYEIRLPPGDLIVEGLAAALAGDLGTLRIRLLGGQGLLVIGHADFLVVARVEATATMLTYTSLTVVVGGLAPGDAFGGRICPFGHNPLEATFRLGTATFEVGGCEFLGGGATMGYEYHRLTIEDSSPELMAADRQKLVFATKAEVDAVLTYRWNHHNACDSFHLALPHADYAASSAPMAGCGQQVPNAPPRQFEEPFDAPVKYRFRYYGGAWVDAEATGCSSYMSCR